MVFVNASREDQPGRGNTLDGATGRTVSAVGLFLLWGLSTAGSGTRTGHDVIGGSGTLWPLSAQCCGSSITENDHEQWTRWNRPRDEREPVISSPERPSTSFHSTANTNISISTAYVDTLHPETVIRHQRLHQMTPSAAGTSMVLKMQPYSAAGAR